MALAELVLHNASPDEDAASSRELANVPTSAGLRRLRLLPKTFRVCAKAAKRACRIRRLDPQ
jgi:hypothetical protein